MGDKTTIFDHEIRLVKFEERLDNVQKDIVDNTTLTKEILDLLKGTNGDGHSTRITVVEKSASRLWKFVGAIALVIAIAFVKNIMGI